MNERNEKKEPDATARASTTQQVVHLDPFEGEDNDNEEDCRVCEECECDMDPDEAEDDICFSCTKEMEVDRLRARLPPNMCIRQVAGNHRKPCFDCGTCDFYYGDYYVYDQSCPWDTD